MSDRGAFCTEPIYCTECYRTVASVLLGDDRFTGACIPNTVVIAGYFSDQRWYFEGKVRPRLEEQICHPVKIALITESGDSIYLVFPFTSHHRRGAQMLEHPRPVPTPGPQPDPEPAAEPEPAPDPA